MQLYVLEGWDKIRDRVTKGASEVMKKGHRARHSKEGSEKSRENPGQRSEGNQKVNDITGRYAKMGKVGSRKVEKTPGKGNETR